MPRLTEEQLQVARDVDLLCFLSARLGNELIKTGSNEYRTREHSSLVITPRYWFWNRGGVGGSNAIDYLVKMQGMGFIDAAREVLSTGVASKPVFLPFQPRAKMVRQPKRTVFKLPQKSENNDNLKRYLLLRAISTNVIEQCLEQGIVYESRFMCSPACVFVGKDDKGQARFATMRGIDSNVKRDIGGSDKRYSFFLPAQEQNSLTLAVFESPIDALSHMTLAELGGFEQSIWRLSLAGTSHIALESFLIRHQQIKRVVLHLDSDEAGTTGALRIQKRLVTDERFKHIKVAIKPARGGKDYNERLMRERLGEEVGDSAGKGGMEYARRDKREVTDTRRTGYQDHSR